MEIELTSANFEGEVMTSQVPVLVDFWASWCGPCQMLAPTIEKIAKEYEGKLKVGKINVDNEGALSAQHAIVSIPTVLLFNNGKIVEKIVGAHGIDDYEEIIEKYI